MARGRHYAKLSLSNAARLSFSDLCILLFMFLSLCRLCVCVFLCSHWSLVDVPLIFFCPADHVPDWQPRVLLGMVEARSVNVKKTTTTTVSGSSSSVVVVVLVVVEALENAICRRGIFNLLGYRSHVPQSCPSRVCFFSTMIYPLASLPGVQHYYYMELFCCFAGFRYYNSKQQ